MSECVKIWYFQQKIRKIFWGGAQTLRDPEHSPSGEGDTPYPRPTPLGTSTPPILKFWVRHCVKGHRRAAVHDSVDLFWQLAVREQSDDPQRRGNTAGDDPDLDVTQQGWTAKRAASAEIDVHE